MTLTLKIAKQCFHMTLWLMMIYHNTKFGSKRLTRSEDIVCTVNKVSNIHCNPDLEHSNKQTKSLNIPI